MRIKLFVSHVRQRGSITPALLSAGSTWHARPLAASVCTVVPAAAVATGYSRTFVRPMRRLTHQPQLETVGKRHPRSLTRQGFDASVFRKRGGNRDRGLLGVLYPERILRMIHTQNEGIYRALITQLDKLARHNRQESYKTRQRYYEAMQRFCRFLAEEYRLQKLTNISGKHLVDYVRHLQENGKAASTIKTELAAIRFWHDKLGEAKYKLPSNADLADQAPLERRKLQGTDRHWTPEQFAAFVTACREADRTDYADIATLTFYVGLRIHEVCRLDTAAVEAWERSGLLTVKGKGYRPAEEHQRIWHAPGMFNPETGERMQQFTQPQEIELIRYIAMLPQEIDTAAKHYDPSRITKYTVELATLFHKFYDACTVKNAEPQLREARLALCAATRQALANALTMLKITCPEKM